MIMEESKCQICILLVILFVNIFIVIASRKSFDIKEVGVVSGFANMGGFLSAVLLPSIFGKVLDHFHSSAISVGYHYGFIIPALFSLLGLLGGLIIIEKRKEVVHQTQLN